MIFAPTELLSKICLIDKDALIYWDRDIAHSIQDLIDQVTEWHLFTPASNGAESSIMADIRLYSYAPIEVSLVYYQSIPKWFALKGSSIRSVINLQDDLIIKGILDK